MLAGSSFFGAESNTIRKSASLESVLVRKSKSFVEEVAEAIYTRAGALGNSHPSVIIGKQKQVIEGLIDIAEALRQVGGQKTSGKNNCIGPTQNEVKKPESTIGLAQNIDSEGDFDKATSRLNFPSSDVEEHVLEVKNTRKRNIHKFAHNVSSSGDMPAAAPRIAVSTTPSCPELTSRRNLLENINKRNSFMVPVNTERPKNDGSDICSTPDGSSMSFGNYPSEASTVIHHRLADDNANARTTFLKRPDGQTIHRRPSFGCFGGMSSTLRSLSATGLSNARKSRSFFNVRRESVLSFFQPKFAAKKSKSEAKFRNGEEFLPFVNRAKFQNLRKQIRSTLSGSRKTLRNAFSRLRSNLITTFKN